MVQQKWPMDVPVYFLNNCLRTNEVLTPLSSMILPAQGNVAGDSCRAPAKWVGPTPEHNYHTHTKGLVRPWEKHTEEVTDRFRWNYW